MKNIKFSILVTLLLAFMSVNKSFAQLIDIESQEQAPCTFVITATAGPGGGHLSVSLNNGTLLNETIQPNVPFVKVVSYLPGAVTSTYALVAAYVDVFATNVKVEVNDNPICNGIPTGFAYVFKVFRSDCSYDD